MSNSSLDRVKIAAPCSADWDQMFAFQDERVRFCSHCNRNVYNLSAMTQSETTTLVYRTEGRLCVRFYRRSDGTMLTENCPVGLLALKRRAAWAVQLLLGMLVSLSAVLGLSNFGPIRKLEEFVAPQPVVMGRMASYRETMPAVQESEMQKPAPKKVSPSKDGGVSR